MIFEYKGRLFFDEDDVDEWIMENHDDPVNNMDPADYLDFDSIWKYDVETIDYESLSNDDQWGVYAEWCSQENKKVAHATSVSEFHKLLEGKK